MNVMRRFSILMLAIASAGRFAMAGERVDEAPNAPGNQELHELRQAIQQQSKQIELLAEQVARLTRALEGQKGPETGVKPPEPAPAAATETSKQATENPAEAPKTTEAAPKAEPPPGGVKHVVAKGETLTSIAKHYNIPVADLKNANKIENERKLQIGQVLAVPTPKPSESPEKKENP